MIPRLPTRLGLPLCLTVTAVCAVIALLPVTPGIRIPVHCANGKMGYIDNTGRMVLAAKWERATPFTQEGAGYVTNINGCWKMDRAGRKSRYLVIQSVQRDPRSLPTKPDSQGMSMMREPRAFRWVMADGHEAFPGRWDEAINFKDDDPAAVQNGDKWGFINRKGEPVTSFEWDQTTGFDGSGRACVAVNHKWGVINRKGELVVPLYFDYLAGFDGQGLCAARLESGCGYINRDGRIAIPLRYVQADPFDRFDMARVRMRDDNDNFHFGWIDRTGKQLIPCIYRETTPEWAWCFTDHELLTVSDEKGYGLINRQGRVIIPTGGGPLAHVEDPLAPGRYWITRTPDPHAKYSSTRPAPFQPACYTQDGSLIWTGQSVTTSQAGVAGTCVSGTLAAILLGIRLKRRTRRPDKEQAVGATAPCRIC